MEIVFFLILLLGVLFAIGYAIYSFFTAPGTVEFLRGDSAGGTLQNEGRYFDGPGGYDATGGYQESRD
jgi:hypothetical protein